MHIRIGWETWVISQLMGYAPAFFFSDIILIAIVRWRRLRTWEEEGQFLRSNQLVGKRDWSVARKTPWTAAVWPLVFAYASHSGIPEGNQWQITLFWRTMTVTMTVTVTVTDWFASAHSLSTFIGKAQTRHIHKPFGDVHATLMHACTSRAYK
jgi:hypothetical protein